MISSAFLFDFLVVAALVGLAAASVFSRDILRSVVLFMVFGLVIALAWARLQAPDVAITEVALGAGLASALLLFAALRFKAPKKHIAAIDDTSEESE